MNLLQRATTGRIWPQQDCWTAFVNKARAVRQMNCCVRVIRMKRGQHAQSRSCAKSFPLWPPFLIQLCWKAGLETDGNPPINASNPMTPPLADATTTIAELKACVLAFTRARDWEQFHSPKNLSMALAAEAGELMEHFLWTDAAGSLDRTREATRRQKIEEEIADVVIYSLEFANVTGIDLAAAIEAKLAANAQKYPVEKARGRSEKYTEL